MTCTTLDHCYPQNAPDRKTAAGTPCYCGRRTWGGGPRRKLQRLKAGAVVHVAGAAHEGTRTVLQHVRDAGDEHYVLDAPVYGRKYFERAELEAR